ncbi:hypothetical protein ACS0TY_001396 [Phlomoides rotata]
MKGHGNGSMINLENNGLKPFFSEKSKYDMLLNNVYKSFNYAILQAMGKSIITMLEWIREYLMKRLQKNRERAKKWEGRLCPRIKTNLDKNMEHVVDCIPIKSNDIYYQVSYFDGGQYSVNLQQCVCVPVDSGIVIYYGGDTLYIPPLPPTFGTRTRRGRRQTKRRLGADEVKKSKGVKGGKATTGNKMKRQQKCIHCRTCGAEGFNSITCPQKQVDTTYLYLLP